MNINNFESYINKTILDRGYSYYIEGNVVEAYKQGESIYIFHIEGSDDYQVMVEIGDDRDILYSECDCPYDYGPVCKHEVAAYYQLLKELNHVSVNDDIRRQSHSRKTLQEILYSQSKEELIEIIINFANQDTALENSLIVKYSKGNKQQELEACQELIDAIVQKYTGREGFIKYRDTGAFVNELEDVLDKARDTEEAILALDIALLLLEEAIGAFQYADDSGGDIGTLVSETIDLISKVVNRKTEMGKRAEIFAKLLDQTDNEIFEGWIDFKIDLLNICLEFADDETFRERLKVKIDSMIDKKSNERYTCYSNERLFELLFLLIEQFGTQEEADQFIQDHLSFSSFREKILINNLQKKNYHKVIEVAKDGEKQDQQYPGLISRWKKFRYEAYKSLSLKNEQQILAKELLFDGDFIYYRDLKELASKEQNEFYTTLKHELKTGKEWNVIRVFLKIIEEENDIEEILDFVRDNPTYVETYAEKLSKYFKEEIVEIYQDYIHSIAKSSSNRKGYQGVCQKIKRYKKISGKTKQEELINELMVLYKKRTAFVDELGKLK